MFDQVAAIWKQAYVQKLQEQSGPQALSQIRSHICAVYASNVFVK